MALIATKQPTLAGVAVGVVQAVAGGDEFVNESNRTLLVLRCSGGAATVSIPPVNPPSGLTFDAVSKAVSGATWTIFGPFPSKWFNNANERIGVAYTSITNIFVSCVRIGGA